MKKRIKHKMINNIEYKYCFHCKQWKVLKQFYKNKKTWDKLCCYCEVCEKECIYKYYKKNPKKLSEYKRKYYKEHKEERKEYSYKYRKENPERISEYRYKYKKENSEKIKKCNRKYKEKNLKKINRYNRKWYKKNSLNRVLSSQLNRSLRKYEKGKNKIHWENLVNWSLNELKNHLKNQFQPNMTWKNYGKSGWHIDHIIPLSWWKFRKYTDKEFKQCWALCNLKPLWAKDNMQKGNRYTGLEYLEIH